MNPNWNYGPFEQTFKWKEKSKIKSGDGKSVGKYKMFVCSDTETKHYDKYLESGESLVFGTGGKASCHFVNEPFAYSTDCVVAQRKSNNTLSKFYYYYLRKNRLGELQSTFTGTGLQHTSKKKIGKILVPILSYEEQERIVTRIEELFSQLDNGVETLQTIKQQMAVYRQAVLKEAFEGRWKFEKLENLCEFITKGTTPQKGEMTENEGEIPFIKVYNLTFNNILDFSINPTFVSKETHTGFLSRSIVYPGDVLMNIVGPPIGKVSIVPPTYPEWNINQAIARFRCKECLYNKFLAYYLGFSETVAIMKRQGKATAGQFNLTLEICRNLSIPLPDIKQQKGIIDWIEPRLSVCDSIEQTVDTELQKAEALRQSILKEAFEGRLI
jgi:type I restriction enzyme S subunit